MRANRSDGTNVMLVRNDEWSYYIVCAMADVLNTLTGKRSVIYVEAQARAGKAMTV
jgi:hypothetical protein